MTAPGRQGAFTLVEVMFASFLGFLLILSVFGILFQSMDLAASLETKAKLNAQARETLDMLGDGRSDGVNDDVSGLRGMKVVDIPGKITRDKYQIKLDDDDPDDNNFLETAKFTLFTITCQGDKDPLPDCVGTEEIDVKGYVGDDPKLYAIQRSVSDRTREIEIMIIDPVGIARKINPARSNRETYRTIYMLNKD